MAARRRSSGSGGGGGGSVRVSLEGMDGLRDQLADLVPGIRAAAFRALKESAEAIRDEAQRNVRVDSGNLQRSVKARYENNRLRAEIGWWDADDLYAALQEFGSRRRPAHPVLGPALEKERAKIADRITAEVRRVTPS